MATMKDVANLAGVSVATVSCHLSGSKPVKPETRMKIDQAIAELKYVPNAAARQLKKAVTKSIGVILPNLDDHLYSEIFRGVVETMQHYNITVSLSLSYSNPKIETESFYAFAHQNISGLVVISCQPENHQFFADFQKNYCIPLVFCINKVKGIEAPFVRFDNYKSAQFITKALLDLGYSHQQIIMGDHRFSSEQEFFSGVYDTYIHTNLPFHEKVQLSITNLTKEHAFKAFMDSSNLYGIPDVILCTSGQTAKGVLEALTALRMHVPEDVLVFTLGEESWNKSDQLQGVIYTTRNAVQLGKEASILLFDIINQHKEIQSHEIVLQDRFTDRVAHIPCRISKIPTTFSSGKELRILGFSSDNGSCLPSLENICRIFSAETGIHMAFSSISIRDIAKHKISSPPLKFDPYDIVLFDLPWLEYFIHQNLITDISDLIEREDFPFEKILSCDINNFRVRDKYYGLPVINGSQSLFYRKDLFEDTNIKAAYFKEFNLNLHPPRTWHEYLRVARFFTKEYNPDSPTKWGTAEMDFDNGSLIAQNSSRFFDFGGRLWNDNEQLQLDTPQNRKALSMMIAPYQYIRKNSLTYSRCTAVESFCTGEAAMCISFNDSAPSILDAINQRLFNGVVGYTQPPGRYSLRAGWGLGIHPSSGMREEIFQFYKWFLRTDISYYYTILSGNSVCKLPYLNGEILSLYPWMALHPHGECVYNDRLNIQPGHKMASRRLYLESLFSDMIRELIFNPNSSEKIITQTQEKMLMLCKI